MAQTFGWFPQLCRAMSRNGRVELEENALRKLCLFSVTIGADVCNSAQNCVSFQGNTLCVPDIIVIIISPYQFSDGFPRHFVVWRWQDCATWDVVMWGDKWKCSSFTILIQRKEECTHFGSKTFSLTEGRFDSVALKIFMLNFHLVERTLEEKWYISWIEVEFKFGNNLSS